MAIPSQQKAFEKPLLIYQSLARISIDLIDIEHLSKLG